MKGMIIGTITPGVMMLYAANFLNMTAITFWAMIAVGLGLVLYGCFCWTRYKGRHWAFMFWGLISPIGLLGIALLKFKEEEK